jgi:hypothetical protein
MENREAFPDKNSCPNSIKYSLSELEMLIAVEFRILNVGLKMKLQNP